MIKRLHRISDLAPVGESESELIRNSLGHDSFGAPLASSINKGSAVKDLMGYNNITEIGYVKLNSLILQDDISRMSENMEHVREGVESKDRMLKQKLLGCP